MKKEKSLSVIGKCPVCGKGNVVKTSYGYCCDEKKGKDCSGFSISQRVHGVTMTDDDINNGYLRVRIGIAAVRPAEFIVLEFSHKVNE